ncbi:MULTISPECIES: hypothetical protein [Arthrobacter]|nr:hypothetical protein [Arthrobacter sp. H35-MC1]MDJ0318804.1 hypothetical protein [Arthrobacter sp. H35-MC1]
MDEHPALYKLSQQTEFTFVGTLRLHYTRIDGGSVDGLDAG